MQVFAYTIHSPSSYLRYESITFLSKPFLVYLEVKQIQPKNVPCYFGDYF